MYVGGCRVSPPPIVWRSVSVPSVVFLSFLAVNENWTGRIVKERGHRMGNWDEREVRM